MTHPSLPDPTAPTRPSPPRNVSVGDEPVTHAPADVVEAALYWGGTLLAVRRLRGDGSLTLGSAEEADFAVADAALQQPCVTFLTRQGGTVRVHPCEGAALTLGADAVQAQARELLAGEEATFTVGALEVRIRWSATSRRITLPVWAGMDFLYSKVLTLALILQAGFVTLVMLTPASLQDDESLVERATAWVQAIQAPPEKTPPPKPKPVVVAVAKPTPQKVFGERTVATSRVARRRAEREQAETLASNALAALGLTGRSGGRGPGVLNLANSGVNQLRGAGLDTGDGGGFGTRGSGPGGGGGALNIGRVGSPGGGGGGDLSLCRGDGCGKKRHVVATVGKTRFVGNLKKEEIQRVVKRHISRIKACFDRELTKDPNLQGKLTTAWVIGASGDVVTSKVAQDTLGSPVLSRCVTRVVDSMKFPKPRGGGTVSVRYPFLFSS